MNLGFLTALNTPACSAVKQPLCQRGEREIGMAVTASDLELEVYYSSTEMEKQKEKQKHLLQSAF